MSPAEHDRAGRAVGDARKRLSGDALKETYGHDEQHAHLHEWPEEPDYDDS